MTSPAASATSLATPTNRVTSRSVWSPFEKAEAEAMKSLVEEDLRGRRRMAGIMEDEEEEREGFRERKRRWEE